MIYTNEFRNIARDFVLRVLPKMSNTEVQRELSLEDLRQVYKAFWQFSPRKNLDSIGIILELRNISNVVYEDEVYATYGQ